MPALLRADGSRRPHPAPPAVTRRDLTRPCSSSRASRTSCTRVRGRPSRAASVITVTVDVAARRTATATQLPPLPTPAQSIAGSSGRSRSRPPCRRLGAAPDAPRRPSRPLAVPTPTPTTPAPPARPTRPARRARPARPPAATAARPTVRPHAPTGQREASPAPARRPSSARSRRPRARGAQASVDALPARAATIDGTPTLDNPTFSLAHARRRARSACRTSSSTSSASRPSCSRSTRPPASSTACAGRSWPRSTRSRPTTAATSTSPPPAPSAGCSSCPRPGSMYGVDANKDGKKDPYNPVDAIFAAARYLKAAGAEQDIAQGDLRLQPRRLVRRLRPAARAADRRPAVQPRRLAHRPDPGPLPGRRQGDLRRRPLRARRQEAHQAREASNAAHRGRVRRDRRGINIFARRARPVVAVNDGRVVRRSATSKRLGRFVQLQDVYGNTYTYAHLGQGRQALPGAEAAERHQAQIAQELKLPAKDAAPTARRLAARRRRPRARRRSRAEGAPPARQARASRAHAATGRPRKQRLFANPRRPNAAARRRRPAGVRAHRRHRRRLTTFDGYLTRVFGLDRKRRRSSSACKKGSRVVAGTVLGRIGKTHARRRPRTCCSRSARPAAAPRGSTRSRSSTAGSCSSRPRSTARRARTRSSARTPTPRRSARSC